MSPRLLVVLGTAAVVSVFLLPPIGVVLGIVTTVLAARQMGRTKPQTKELLHPDGTPVTVKVATQGRTNAVFALVLGITAIVLGTLVLLVLVTFWGEVSDYAECRESTVTNQGEDRCRDAFSDAILGRFGR